MMDKEENKSELLRTIDKLRKQLQSYETPGLQNLPETLLENSPDAYIIINPSQEIIYLNTPAKNLFARTDKKIPQSLPFPSSVICAPDNCCAAIKTVVEKGVKQTINHKETCNDNIIHQEWNIIPVGEQTSAGWHVACIIRDITEIISATSRADDMMVKHEMIVAAFGQVIYDYNIEQEKIQWSGNTAAVLGYSPEEMGNLDNWKKMIHPEDRKKATEELNAAMSSMKIYETSYRFLHKTGEYKHMQDRGYFIAGDDGKAMRMLGVMQNISEKIKMEVALSESETKYKSLFENSILGIYLTTPDGRLLMANPEMVHMLGYSSFEELSAVDVALRGYANAEYRELFLEKIKKTGEVKGFECIWKRKDDSLLYARENARALHDDHGNIIFIEGTVEDITYLKSAEAALRRSEENLAITLESIGDAVVVTDTNGIITRINKVAEKLSGFARTESLGKPIHEIFRLRKISGEAAENPVYKVIEQGHTVEMENNVEIVSADGSVYQISDSAAPIRKDDGSVLGVVMVFRDIFEKYLREKKLTESEERFRKLAENTSMGILIFQDDKWVYANRAALSVTGFSKEELYTKPFWEIARPEDREMVKDRGRMRQQGENPEQLNEIEIVCKGGDLKWIEFWADVVEFNGKSGGLLIFTDITEKKNAEREISAGKERYRVILEAIPDLLVRINRDGYFTDYYTARKEDLAIPPEKVVGSHLRVVLSEEMATKALEKIRQCIEQNTIQTFEYQLRIGSELKHFEARFVKASDNEALSLIRDVTIQKQSENNLREQQQYLIDLLNSVSAPLFVKDRQHRFVLVNDALCRLTGSSRESLLGKSDYDFFPKDQADIFWAFDDIVFTSGRESINEEAITDKQGKVHDILTKKMLYTNSFGEQFIVGIISDVTDEKKYRREIEKLNEQLEQRVAARTVQLSDTIQKLQEEISYRERAEAALYESEDKFRSVIEQSVDGISLVNEDGIIVEWNRGIEVMTGYTRDDVIGRYIWDIESLLIDPGQTNTGLKEKLKSIASNIIKNRRVDPGLQEKTGSIYTREGEKREILLSVYTITSKDRFYIGRFARDITDAKKYETALQKSEAQYRALFENANVAILIVDAETHDIIAANDNACETYKYSRSALCAKNLSELTADYENEIRNLNFISEGKPVKNFETVHFSSNGDEIILLSNSSMIEYNGRPAFMSVNRDITELKASEIKKSATLKISQLIHTKDDIDEIYRSIHDIIGGLMPAKNFYIALYQKENDLITFPYFVDERDSAPSPRRPGKGLTEYVIREGLPLLSNTGLLKKLNKEGKIDFIGSMSVDWMGVPLKIGNSVIGMIAVQSYSSRIRYTEEEMKILGFVSEQVAMLISRKQAEEELIKAKELAEESDRLKSSILANMSHELRTPMTGILGFASLLEKEIKDPGQSAMVQNILASGRRLMTTMNSLISLSQLEASKKPVNLKEADLYEKIQIAVMPLQQDAISRHIYLTINDGEPVFARFDENFLLQIISNITSNAIKFTSEGGVTLRAYYMNESETDWAVIEISDTGIGIAPEHYELIFQEFRQASEGHSRKYEGSGIGLSLCRKMAAMMNGKIVLESTVGKGTRFRIMLPAVKSPIITSGSEKEKSKTETAVQHTASGRKKYPEVLVVEDNQVNVELIMIYLKKTCRTSYANDALTAINMAKTKHYDIILMDINLGAGMDGIEASRHIRKIKGYEKTPIIALTGYTTDNEVSRLLAGGCTHYLAKPFDNETIVKLIREITETDRHE